MTRGPHGGLYLEVEGKPRLVNDLARVNPFDRGREVSGWREAGKLAAKASRAEALRPPVVVYVHDLYKSRSHDVGAVLFGVKGFLDGVVDAGLLPDDSAKYVHGLFFLAPQKADRYALGLELVEQ